MEQSILNSIKKVLGLTEADDSFDVDIIMHTNSVLATLAQIGIGPIEGFGIEGPDEMWDDFLGLNNQTMHSVKTFIYLSVRLVFDPPNTSFALDSMKNQIQELAWRLNVVREEEEWTEGVRL